ncbi:MAG: hypothetical protein ACRD9W_23215 [Terriglobia bacterium]
MVYSTLKGALALASEMRLKDLIGLTPYKSRFIAALDKSGTINRSYR